MPLIPIIRLALRHLRPEPERPVRGPAAALRRHRPPRRVERPAILTAAGEYFSLTSSVGVWPVRDVGMWVVSTSSGYLYEPYNGETRVVFGARREASDWIAYLVDQAHDPGRCRRGYLALDLDDYPGGTRYQTWLEVRAPGERERGRRETR